MEPNLTFYYGREIEAIEPEGDGWALVLEGGPRIVNLDPEYPMPDEVIVGMKLSVATLGRDWTTLYVGTDDNPKGTQINLNPTQYGIDDPSMHHGLVMPQSSNIERAEAGLPVDEPSAPGERAVDGPDEAAAADREQPDPQLAEADALAQEAAGDAADAETVED